MRGKEWLSAYTPVNGMPTMQLQQQPKFQQGASIYTTVLVLREASTSQLTAS